jgi:hypothetical protein
MKFTVFNKMAEDYRLKKDAKERAAELGCRIKAAIDEGKFNLGYGYLQFDGRVCHGCAVAAAAFSCGLRRGDQEDCQERAVNYGLMSPQEAAQLEMGYEAFSWCFTWGGSGGVEVDLKSPFFKLGKKMSLASRHRSERSYRDLRQHLAAEGR